MMRKQTCTRCGSENISLIDAGSGQWMCEECGAVGQSDTKVLIGKHVSEDDFDDDMDEDLPQENVLLKAKKSIKVKKTKPVKKKSTGRKR